LNESFRPAVLKPDSKLIEDQWPISNGGPPLLCDVHAQDDPELTIHFPLFSGPNPIPEGAIEVPGGYFWMGGNDSYAKDREKPVHQVYVGTFWIYKTHVTNAQFTEFVDATNYVTTAENKGWSLAYNGVSFDERAGTYWRAPKGPGSNIIGFDDYPVLHVSWYDANAFCNWAGGRMPTEAEWEKAARGTSGTRMFPWAGTALTGNLANFCDKANCPAAWAVQNQNDGFAMSSPVGYYPAGASPYGVLDMAGNVTDWVYDWYDEDYYQNSPDWNPSGPLSGIEKVHRGASWYSGYTNQRSAARNFNIPIHTHDHGGFRCVFFQ
jgi:formylglycine-generating enzyme required for sulfatase activity